MNLPNDGTSQLPKAGFDWITFKKGHLLRSERSKFAIFLQLGHFLSIYSKSDQYIVLYFGMQLPQDELWREWFDWITLKVTAIDQYLRNRACCDQCLYEIHIVSHIWPFSYLITFDLWRNWKGRLLGLWVIGFSADYI